MLFTLSKAFVDISVTDTDVTSVLKSDVAVNEDLATDLNMRAMLEKSTLNDEAAIVDRPNWPGSGSTTLTWLATVKDVAAPAAPLELLLLLVDPLLLELLLVLVLLLEDPLHPAISIVTNVSKTIIPLKNLNIFTMVTLPFNDL
jgi:hypothetical protein